MLTNSHLKKEAASPKMQDNAAVVYKNGFDNIPVADEKLFIIKAVCNKQNNCILAPSVSAILSVIRIISYVQRPKSVMVGL